MVNEAEIDDSGRYILLNTKTFNENVLLCNICAPNKDKEQATFYSSLKRMLAKKNVDQANTRRRFRQKNNIYEGKEALKGQRSIT